MKYNFLLGLLIAMLIVLTSYTQSIAQEVRLGLVVTDFTANSARARNILDEFEAENPGIIVEMISNSGRFASQPYSADEISTYLSGVEYLVQQGDVISIESNQLLPEATIGGYFLDLRPLVDQDPDLSTDDFIPQVWQAAQWDGGIWAIPATYNLITLLYDPSAFEEAGLTPPDSTWTIAQFEGASEALVGIEEEPTPFHLSTATYENLALLQILAGGSLYDGTQLPTAPDYSASQLTEIIDALARMQANGLIHLPGQRTESFDAPLVMATPLSISFSNLASGRDLALSPDAGQFSALSFAGYAVSGGTAYPEESYKLAKFLSHHPIVESSALGSARQSVDLYELGPISRPDEDIRQFVDAAVETAIPWSELRYVNYLEQAITAINTGSTPSQALEEVQAAVLTELIRLMDNSNDLTLTVNTPPPRPVVQEGDIVLEFAVNSSISPNPSRINWERTKDEFLAQHPEVADINLTYPLVSRDIENSDCFYASSNFLNFSTLNYETLRDLRPLLESDPDYNADDFVGEVLSNFERDGRLYGLPMTMEPYMMWVNRTMFEDAGAIYPGDTWTINEFLTALELLSIDAEEPIISVYENGTTHLLMLISAFGGLPIDTSTTPFDLNYTDPATIDAIQQVLDLAKSDQLQYLNGFYDSGSGVTPIIITAMDQSNIRGGQLVMMSNSFPGNVQAGDYKTIPFPQGSYTPMSYNVGGAYITVHTEYPELCFRFIQYAANQPDLFSSMPVRHSIINDPRLETAFGPDRVAFFQNLASILEQSNTVEFTPARTLPYSEYFVESKLKAAFDAYILNDADLESALARAEELGNLYINCLENFEPTEQNPNAEISCTSLVDSN